MKTKERLLIGNEVEPVAEYTKLGWFVMSSRTELDEKTMMLTQTSQPDYEALCRLDVQGLKDRNEHNHSTVYDKFKEQLTRSPKGLVLDGTALERKPPTPSGLSALRNRLEKRELTEHYDAVIKEQIE